MKSLFKRLLPYIFVFSIFFIVVGVSQTDTLSEDERAEINSQLLKIEVEESNEIVNH
ncbi:putative membrane protein YgcG [Cytobacillus purgationiresistens]|uniref:Membrane protein YgcG n=1 Tax=Cytobacillus purgationiresistens TaxID=863449 RepID=A0ABU0AD07_9BACI|nr:putative membrane protein YgcG [Cytobacillus purgationiresistens]